ncbi:MAG: hypothetical protein FWH03_08510 [Firmicutes bacterium]|nr:hypothetical protein [Bacillota bacterium]
MEAVKYRRFMGIISLLLAVFSFSAALTSCIVYAMVSDALLKVAFLPLLIIAAISTLITSIFSVFNTASKIGIVSIAINGAAIICLIIAFVQL